MQILETTKTKLGNKIELIGTQGIGKVLIIGVFHGDEPQGKYLIERYLKEKHNHTPLTPSLSHKGRGLITQKAKLLRRNSTDAEQKLWSLLRANKLENLHFRRQQPIGKYIVDFVCFSKKLIIELDGGQHNTSENIKKDNIRTDFLKKEGFQVIRLWNNDVINNPEGTYEYIMSSLPTGGGGVGRGGLLFIPCLNPDGMQNNTRTNTNGVDLNRNFPTKNWGQDTSQAGDNPANYYGGKSPASEIETKFVIDVIEKYKPTLILTLHAPYKVVNYDGPAEDIAQKISDIIHYPVEASIGYPTPGSFGTYCGVERNIPTITLELDEKIPIEELVQPIFEIFDTLTA